MTGSPCSLYKLTTGRPIPFLPARTSSGLGESVPMAPGITADIGRNALVLPYGEDESLAGSARSAGRTGWRAGGACAEQETRPAARAVPQAVARGDQRCWNPADLRRGHHRIPGTSGWGTSAVRHQGRHHHLREGPGWRTADRRGRGRRPLSRCHRRRGLAGRSGWPCRVRVRTFFTGTFAKHPLALAAARAVLGELQRRGPSLQEDLNARTGRSRCSGSTWCLAGPGSPSESASSASLFRFTFPNEPGWSVRWSSSTRRC